MPELHALLIGVSDYPNLRDDAPEERTLGLRPLESAALTVARVGQWLEAHDGLSGWSLGSCTVMAAPSAAERDADPSVSHYEAGCSFDDFMRAASAWRRRASAAADDLALFYFAGHGVQRRQRDHVLLLQDFGAEAGPVLGRAFDSSTLIEGMSITDEFPCMARRQLYVFDACRMALDAFREYVKNEPWQFWDWKPPTNEQRRQRWTPVLHTATDGSKAFGVAGDQSIFSDALLRCLDGAAAREDGEYDDGRLRWTVSFKSLVDGLEGELEHSNEVYETEQTFDYSRPGEDLVLRVVDPPPDAEISVRLLPEDVCGEAVLEVLDDADAVVRHVEPVPDPYEDVVSAGYYSVRARRDPVRPYIKNPPRLVRPPGRTFVVRLGEA